MADDYEQQQEEKRKNAIAQQTEALVKTMRSHGREIFADIPEDVKLDRRRAILKMLPLKTLRNICSYHIGLEANAYYAPIENLRSVALGNWNLISDAVFKWLHHAD